MTPFHKWVKILANVEDVRVSVQFNGDKADYDGKILIVEDELCFFKEGSFVHLLKIDDIISIGGHINVFAKLKNQSLQYKANNPFWKWLKNLEDKNCPIDVYTNIKKGKSETYTYTGEVIKVDKELLLLKGVRYHLLLIDNIVTISGKEPLFDIKSKVRFQEV